MSVCGHDNCWGWALLAGSHNQNIIVMNGEGGRMCGCRRGLAGIAFKPGIILVCDELDLGTLGTGQRLSCLLARIRISPVTVQSLVLMQSF